ncbi:MAG: class E sortase [Micrococcales bacterium]|nr:class E sortase [Micrococcales bacterium]
MRRKLDWVTHAALVVLGVGVGVAGGWGWSFYGTSWQADRQQAAMIEDFRDQVPLPDTVAPADALHTNFAADPPPATTPGSGTLGLLIIPSWAGTTGVYHERIGGVIPILQGTSMAVLNTGAAGHYPETALPGQVGNFSVAGHRRSYGNNFLHLDLLRAGDVVAVETKDTWYVYQVTSYEVVLPNDWQVTAPVPDSPGSMPTDRMLTMTTCTSLTQGAWGHDHRWVVHAKLLGWLPQGQGVPEQVVAAVPSAHPATTLNPPPST